MVLGDIIGHCDDNSHNESGIYRNIRAQITGLPGWSCEVIGYSIVNKEKGDENFD